MAMQNFTFSLPTRVHFGKGQIARIQKEIPADAKVLITYGGGSILKNGVMDQVRAALAGHSTVEFGGIEPNPGYETLMKAVQIVKEQGITFLLAVGGGSTLDGTKFIAAAACYDHAEDPWEILLTGSKHIKAALPLGSVLTLPATGSEMNSAAVITRYETKDKLSMASEHVIPRFAVLDPETTFSLPVKQTANGIVDTFVHTSEQYMTYPLDAQIPDRFAESVYTTLLEDGPKVMADGNDYSARANIMWAATMGLNRILATGVPQDWVSHAMGHELTAMFGIDHGRTLAITMPAVWDYCREDKKGKLIQFANRVLGICEGSEDDIIDAAIAAVRNFFTSLGCPCYLSDYDIDETAIPALVAKLTEHAKTGIGERQKITPEDMGKIYALALKGGADA